MYKTGDDPSFSDLLERVRNVTLEAYENQDIPFQKLVEELKPERDLSRNVFYQVMFNFSDMSKVCMRLEGLEVSLLSSAEVQPMLIYSCMFGRKVKL